MEGGREAERAARQAFIDSERERQSAGIKHLQDIQAQALQERETTRGKPDDIGEHDETERLHLSRQPLHSPASSEVNDGEKSPSRVLPCGWVVPYRSYRSGGENGPVS